MDSFSAQAQAVIDALPGHIALMDDDGALFAMNEVWRRFALANPEPDETARPGLASEAICPRAGPVAARAAEAGVQAVIAGRTDSFAMTYRCRDAATGQLWFRLSASRAGAPFGNAALILRENVTEEKGAEGRFQLAFGAATNGLVLFDEHGVVLEVNRTMTRIFGFQHGEFLRRPVDAFAPDLLAKALKRRADPDDFLIGEVLDGLIGIKKGGRKVRLDVTLFEPPGAGGREFLCAFGDASRRGQAKFRIDAPTERCRGEAQTLQAQRLEAMGRLTADVAHDFNNLLTVILGNAEELMKSLEDIPRLKRTAEMVLNAAQRGANLTRGLLSFGLRQSLTPRAVDVGRLIAEDEHLFRSTLGAAIAIRIERAADLWSAHIDPMLLRNAILNLVINAREAMPEGGELTIRVTNERLDAEASPGDYVRVCVTDTGAGMAPEILRRVFEPLFTTKGVGKGSGLGLSTVYGFVRQSGGHAEVVSAPGRGTEVNLYLPTAPEPPSASR